MLKQFWKPIKKKKNDEDACIFESCICGCGSGNNNDSAIPKIRPTETRMKAALIIATVVFMLADALLMWCLVYVGASCERNDKKEK